MGEIKFLAGIVMFALFVLSILAYAIGFGIENDSALNINQGNEFNNLNTQLQGNLSTFRSDTDSGSISLMTSKIGNWWR